MEKYPEKLMLRVNKEFLEALELIAQQKGITKQELIRNWVGEKIGLVPPGNLQENSFNLEIEELKERLSKLEATVFEGGDTLNLETVDNSPFPATKPKVLRKRGGKYSYLDIAQEVAIKFDIPKPANNSIKNWVLSVTPPTNTKNPEASMWVWETYKDIFQTSNGTSC